MTLLERVRTLCYERDMTLASLEKTLGFGNGTLSRWDTSSPSSDKLAKVADFFSVSTDQLLGRELTQKDEKDIAKDLNKIMDKIRNGEDGPLHYNGEEIDQESLSLLEDAINLSLKQLKVINKEKYNPNKNKK